jgi:hypothetical protein
MQPYFFPYGGYFRLFTAADLFVILDCVQFPRRGRVHRCEVPGRGGGTEWLTLPLARQSRDALIRDLAFAPGARQEFDRRLARYAWIAQANGPSADAVRRFLNGPFGPVIGYLETGLRLVAALLQFETEIVRSSTFDIDASLRGQDRIIAIVKAAGGTRYVNSPGGRDLYDAKRFVLQGIDLCFLRRYGGPRWTILQALMGAPPESIRAAIHSEVILEEA